MEVKMHKIFCASNHKLSKSNLSNKSKRKINKDKPDACKEYFYVNLITF